MTTVRFDDTTWDEVALGCGTDKASSHHGYMAAYRALFGPLQIARMLEIGVAGGRSLQLWRKVLPDAFIVGVDNNPACLLHQRERSAVVLADAADAAQMAAVSTLYGPFDVVVDDGSHDHDDVRITFEELFPRLASGGVYVIEDLDGADGWVREFVARWHGRFIDCPVSPSLEGRYERPGLIVVDASW